jgi:hypothetical protein
MSDYETLALMLRSAKIDFEEDWNRQILISNETRIVKWISVFTLDDSRNKSEVQFMFNYDGKLESICPLTRV